MAHYAKLGANNKVIGVHVVPDAACLNASGVEDEEVGRQYLENIHNWPLWKRTSFNTIGGVHSGGKEPLRGNFAAIGMIYDEDNDIFIDKKPFASWTLNTTTGLWEAPVAKPDLTAEQISQNQAGTHEWIIDWDESTSAWVANNAIA
tara:strand:+ start:67 stop:507 length:441 start_codon:yes stop_codon:yes gene_type:complete